MTHEALEKEVAALTKDKEDAWELIEEFRHENSEQRCQLAAAQATNERLREAILDATPLVVKALAAYNDDDSQRWYDKWLQKISANSDTTALDARLRQAKVVSLREAADKADREFLGGNTDWLRRMADEIEKGEQDE